MPVPGYTPPTNNTETSIAEPLVTTALEELKSILSGNVDSSNIAPSGVGNSEIAASAVTNGKIEANTIRASKLFAPLGLPLTQLEEGSSGELLICNSSGVVTATTVSGAVAIDDTGASTLTAQAGDDTATLPADASYNNVVQISCASGWWIVWGKIYVTPNFTTGPAISAKLLQDLTQRDIAAVDPANGAVQQTIPVGPELLIVSGAADTISLQGSVSGGGSAVGKLMGLRVL